MRGPLPNRERWLFERVLENDWLREEFLNPGQTGKALWQQKTVQAYQARVDAFLEHLLLLIYLSSG
jgi:hypothetical protein